MEDDIKLTTEEVRRFIDKDLTEEQVETIKDTMALFAVIVYENKS